METDMNDWDDKGIPKYWTRSRQGNNTSMHDKSIEGTVLKLVDSIKDLTAQLNVVRNETAAATNEIKSIKTKNEMAQQQQPNKSLNKTNDTKGLTNKNNKCAKVPQEVAPDHDLTDLESRVHQTNGKIDALSNGLETINKTLLLLQQQLQQHTSEQDDEDMNDIEESNDFAIEGDNNEANILIDIDQ
jgi:hypothetical protein